MTVLRGLALVCVAGWLGMMAFVGLTGVPLMVRAMDRVTAGRVVLALLPSYYAWGGALCMAALVASVLQAASGREGRLRPLAGAALCGVMLALLVWASTLVVPRVAAAWRADDATPFALSHRALVRLNIATMAAAAAFLCVEIFTLPSRRGR